VETSETMDKISATLVFSLVLIVLGLVLFVVPVLPVGSPWQQGNGSNGTPDGSQNPKSEPSLNALSASWSFSGVSFWIKNTGKETATLTAVYLEAEGATFCSTPSRCRSSRARPQTSPPI